MHVAPPLKKPIWCLWFTNFQVQDNWDVEQKKKKISPLS